jgi:drug/metabolite transporter (DMT)-like permease
MTVVSAAATERRRRIDGIACVVLSAVAFGAMAIMARFAFAAGVDTATLLALRFAIAAFVLLALLRARGMTVPRGSTLGVLVALGALGYGGQAACYFTALRLAPAGLAALLLYLHPALVALLAAAFLHERLTGAKLVALAIALAGTTLTVAPALGGGFAAAPEVATGLAFAVASAAFYAAYIVVAASLGRRAAALPMSAVVTASAAAVFGAATWILGPQWPQTPSGWLAVVGIALLSTVVAITLYFAGLERIGPMRASTLSTVEPLCTVVLAALLLDEAIAPAQLAGGALILAAAVLIARARGA